VRIDTLGSVEALDLAEAVWACCAEVFDDTPPYDEWRRETFERHVAREGFRLVVARAGKGVAGLAWGHVGHPGEHWSDLVRSALDPLTARRWVGDHLEVVELAVLPAHRGAGLGGRLHDALLDGVRRRCLLSTSDDPTDPAVRLHLGRGWRRLGTLEPGRQVMGLDLREADLEVDVVGGTEKRELFLSDPDDTWPAAYAVHEARIREALGDTALAVEHIGSTSVPGLAAKPIIDVLVTVPDLVDEAAYLPALLGAGYLLRVREPGHRLVRPPGRDVHVHVLEPDDPAAHDYLLFRDHLRRDPADRALYEQTKRDLVSRDWADMNAYADAKTDVVEAVKARARRAGGATPWLLPAPTERLRFRLMRPSDVELVASLETGGSRGPEGWIAWQRDNYRDHGFGLWVVETRDGAFVGDCGLTVQDVEGTPHVELGWHVRSDLRRRGYASEAAVAVCRAAAAGGLRRLIALIRPDNDASQGVARRIGMRLDGEVRAHGAPALLFVGDLAPGGEVR